MSRCGSCPLYWTDPMCKGDLGIEKCAEKLQNLVSALQYRANKAACQHNTLLEMLKQEKARAEKAEIEAKAAIRDLEKAMSFDYGDLIWGFLCGICDNQNCGGVCKPKWTFHEEE